MPHFQGCEFFPPLEAPIYIYIYVFFAGISRVQGIKIRHVKQSLKVSMWQGEPKRGKY